MKRKIILIGLLFTAATVFVSCGKCDMDKNQQTQTSGSTYACPMHPEVTSTKPANCSKCGMALQKI